MTLTVPAWARAAITSSHAAVWSATLLPTSGSPIALPMTAGTLTVDADAWPRSSAEISLGDLSLAPTSGASPVTPFGARVRLRYTLSAPDGSTVTIAPCPDLVVDTVDVGRGRSVGMTIRASDDSLRISTDVYATPATPPPDARTVSAAIAYIIRRTIPAATITDTLNATGYVGNGYSVEGDPWAAIEDLVDTAGGEVYVAPSGAFLIKPAPAIKPSATDTLKTGAGGTVVGTLSQVLRGYNRVLLVHRGEDGRAIIGRWADESGGPLDVDGPYGRVTYAETRDRTTTQSAADAAAATLARRVAGRVRDVTVEAVGAPWIEPGDTVLLQLPSGNDTLLLSAVEHDLSGVEPSLYRFRTDTLGPL